MVARPRPKFVVQQPTGQLVTYLPCMWCGELFAPRITDQAYCSSACVDDALFVLSRLPAFRPKGGA